MNQLARSHGQSEPSQRPYRTRDLLRRASQKHILPKTGPGAEQAGAEYRRLGRPALFYLPLPALEVESGLRQRAFHERRMLPPRQRAQINRGRDAALSRLAGFLKRRHEAEILILGGTHSEPVTLDSLALNRERWKSVRGLLESVGKSARRQDYVAARDDFVRALEHPEFDLESALAGSNRP